METEVSLPHSQVPATCPYPEPDRFSPHPPNPTSWRYILILFLHLSLGLPSGLFSSVYPTKMLCTPLLSPAQATCTAHLILLEFITRKILGEEYRSFSSSLCSFLQPLVTLPLLGPYILLNTIVSYTLILRSSLNGSNQIFKFLDSKLEDKIFYTEWQQAFPDFNLLLISSRIRFWFGKVVPKILTLQPFQRNYHQSLCMQ